MDTSNDISNLNITQTVGGQLDNIPSSEEVMSSSEEASNRAEGSKKTSQKPTLNLKSASNLIITSNQFFKVEKRTLNFSNGDKYSGDFDLTHARYHGKGKFRWATGAKYDGDWWKGKRNGHGTLKSADGSSFTGEWLHNKRHGMGEFRRFDGAVYKGPWVDDKMCGDGGVFTYSNGDRYVGRWVNGQKQGRGEYIYNTDEIDLKKRKEKGLLENSSKNGSRFSSSESHQLHRKYSLMEASKKGSEDVSEDEGGCFHSMRSSSIEDDEVLGEGVKGGDSFKRQSNNTSPATLSSVQENSYDSPKGKYHGESDVGSGAMTCSESPVVGDIDTEPVEMPPSSFLTSPLTPLTPKEQPIIDDTSSPWNNKLPSVVSFEDMSSASSSSSASLVPSSLVTSSVSLPKLNVKYRGEFHEGESCGEGESTNEAGDRYYGGWKDGKRHGRGAYRWLNDGKTLRGDWKEGVANGKGILTRPKAGDDDDDDEEYDEGYGVKSSPKPHSKGGNSNNGSGAGGLTYTVLLPGENRKQALQQAANGQEVVMYEGEFKEGVFHGMGTEYEHDRSGLHLDATYKGPFHKGLRDSYGNTVAFGRKTEVDGSVYVGWFSEDQAHGTHGDKYDAESGSRYIGSWWNGNRHGTGKRWSKDGSTFEGNWLKDKPNGRGHTKFANGDEYFGEYLLGARHGPGIYNRQDGVDVYIGFWAHGIAKGRGFRRYANGAFYIGDMETNLPHGEGVMRNGDGASWYYGGWKLGKRHGAGVELFGGTGSRFEGVWRDGVKDNTFDDNQLMTQSGSAIAPICEGTWLVRPSVVEEGEDGDGDEDSTIGGASPTVSKYSSFIEEGASVASTAGTVRSTQVVTYPALYFDPDIHQRIMVQKWNQGVLLFEFPDIATVMRPRLKGEEGYVGNEDATNYLLNKSKPHLKEQTSDQVLPRAYSSTRRRLAGTKSKDAVVFPRNLMPSQVRAPVASTPIQVSESRSEFIRRSQHESVTNTTPFVASCDQFEDRRRVLENSIYEPGQSMFILVDDEILSDGIIATPDIASEVRGEVRARQESKKKTEDSLPIDREPSSPPPAASIVHAIMNSLQDSKPHSSDNVIKEEKLKKKKLLRNKNRKWVEAVVVRFVGEPGRHQLSICMGPPLDPTSTTLEGLIVALTPMNHFSFPVNTSRPPLRTKHLPAPELDITERRAELIMVKELLACKPSEFSNEQREVSQFVERKAAQVVQDALDTAERTRQENLDRKKQALAETERLKEPPHIPAFGMDD